MKFRAVPLVDTRAKRLAWAKIEQKATDGGDGLPRRKHEEHKRREVANHAGILQSSDT